MLRTFLGRFSPNQGAVVLEIHLLFSARTSHGRKFCKRSFHSLRPGFVSSLANQGVAPEQRRAMTGHKTDGTHARYTHLETETLRKAVNRLPGIPDRGDGLMRAFTRSSTGPPSWARMARDSVGPTGQRGQGLGQNSSIDEVWPRELSDAVEVSSNFHFGAVMLHSPCQETPIERAVSSRGRVIQR